MRLKYGIAIAGAHGKTTTTLWWPRFWAREARSYGRNRWKVEQRRSHAKLGQGVPGGRGGRKRRDVFKAFSYDRGRHHDGSEHLDYYGDMDRIKNAFLEFINKVPFYGVAVLCLDDEHIQAILPRV